MPGTELGLRSSPAIPPVDPFPPRKLKIKDLGKIHKEQRAVSLPKHSVLVRFHPLSLLLFWAELWNEGSDTKPMQGWGVGGMRWQ